MRLLPILSLCLPLLTAGCFIGDGVAHVVKLANKNLNSSSDETAQPAALQAPAPEAVAAPVERDPAPLPAAAPRDRIQVEQLAPPRS